MVSHPSIISTLVITVRLINLTKLSKNRIIYIYHTTYKDLEMPGKIASNMSICCEFGFYCISSANSCCVARYNVDVNFTKCNL